MTDLSALKELAQKATPGPWCCRKGLGGGKYLHVHSKPLDNLAVAKMDADAEYIAAASPEVILQLCEVVEKAPALIAAMAECQEIARRWEPDNSSGKERQWLVRGRDAAKALRSALAALEGE